MDLTPPPKGSRTIPHAWLAEVSRRARMSSPTRTHGDGMAGSQFLGGTGSGPLASDIGQTWFGRITRVVDDEGDRVRYDVDEVAIDWYRTEAESPSPGQPTEITGDFANVVLVEGGKNARNPHNPAFSLDEMRLGIGDIVIVRRSRMTPIAFEIIGHLTAAGESGSGYYGGGVCCDIFNTYRYRCEGDELIETTIVNELCILDGCPVITVLL